MNIKVLILHLLLLSSFVGVYGVLNCFDWSSLLGWAWCHIRVYKFRALLLSSRPTRRVSRFVMRNPNTVWQVDTTCIYLSLSKHWLWFLCCWFQGTTNVLEILCMHLAVLLFPICPLVVLVSHDTTKGVCQYSNWNYFCAFLSAWASRSSYSPRLILRKMSGRDSITFSAVECDTLPISAICAGVTCSNTCSST